MLLFTDSDERVLVYTHI